MGVPLPLGVSASGRSPYWPTDQANSVVQGTFAAVRAGKPFAIQGPMNLFIWASYTTSLTTVAATLGVTLGAAGVIAAGGAVNSPLVPPGTTLSSTTVMVLPIYTYWGKTKVGVAKITDLPATNWLIGAAVTGPGIPTGTTVTAIDTPAVAANNNVPTQLGTISISNAVTATTPDEGLPDSGKSPFEFALAAASIASGVDATATFTGATIIYNATIQLERSFDGGYTWLPCNIGSSGILAQWAFAVTGGVPISTSFGEPEKMVAYRLNALAYTGIAGTTLNYRISTTGQAATTLSVPTI